MENLEKINVRVYALLINEGNILFLQEKFAGKNIIKLPGGGLELGEGTQETLERELLEELNLKIEVKEHFYTQDFFLKSEITPKSQLLSIYYLVECKDLSTLKIVDKDIKSILWLPIKSIDIHRIDLPIDRIVIRKLIQNKFFMR
ncbi:NUDIX domain-containing protein [Apibacter muscae]|uniref:NUDIX domain-containing protein n=1 Tax=Apibacter muscae TaxID=2509004 RepID=A0A563DCT2_9FLAO|nr:NUDIX domain-containing protein [Apibacter muscae]TWP24062.1 NUDIX domain-containing protein [Apibacter muscae]TWP27741.1 NUDIX domain-containing protein [Apibacter muscae]